MALIDYQKIVNSLNPALLTILAALTVIVGCSSSSSQCGEPYTLTWTDQLQLAADIETLSSPDFEGRKTATTGATRSRAYIVERMQQAKLAPWNQSYEQGFDYDYQFGRRHGVNIIGMHQAAIPSEKWRIVVAHYDHLGKKGYTYYPGADDNASGVSAMLALAEYVSTQASVQPLSTNLLFVATDAEEPGLYGSEALVERLLQHDSVPTKPQIELMINLDMIGRPSRRNHIYIEGRRGFNQFAQLKVTLQQTVGLCIRANHPPEAGKSIQRIDWLRASDHYPFHKANIPWLYFGVPPHQDYHQPSDKAAKIDMNFLAAVTETAYQLLVIDSYLLNNQLKQ
ncbi:M28 family peptidase [Shewanella psychrotolerans]|uniref:M28 family peptidase n=1 Tax=Shewanella psychrotolerans TaxID=2864206 RepID=UPI001C65FEB9|nr:M28 family peptidase [Shewanella psychrotolerans]QYK00972.1 M28 family peptidase [Shewanella psychrotolerans]